MNNDEMKLTVKKIFRILGANNINVNVQLVQGPIVAGAVGINPQGLFGLPVTGTIFINDAYLQENNFTLKEIQFILAHESVHIFYNHLVSSLGWRFIESVAKGPENKYSNIVELFKVILALFSSERLPPNIISLRDNEYEADYIAVRFVTNDSDAAESCLKRLSRGNLDGPSHLWELWGINLPAMTVSERLVELRRRIPFGHYL